MGNRHRIWSKDLTKSCDHWHEKISIGDHFVWASRLLSKRPDDFTPDAAVYLDPAWADWTKLDPERYLLLEWPDYGVVEVDQLRAALQWTNDRMDKGDGLEVGCLGGHGRTGTFLACLLVDREGRGAQESIDAVRSRYCSKAIETPGQEQLVYEYVGEGPRPSEAQNITARRRSDRQSGAGRAPSTRQAKRTPRGQKTLGDLILAAIRRAIERTTEASKALPLPGEGDERPFRNWLRSNLLVRVLGWPEDNIRIGEGFDILLLDEQDKEVVTIETKTPFHKASKEERKKFRERLAKLPRLRAAYFTNGPEWDRLDLDAPEGIQRIRREVSLDISQATADQSESFFAPLRGDRHFHWGQRNRSRVTRTQPHILEQLARDLDETVGNLADALRLVFQRYDEGDAGTTIQSLTRNIFDDWCRRSLQAPVSQVLEALQQILQDSQPDRGFVSATLRDQGFTPRVAEGLADRLLALQPNERGDTETLRSVLVSAYHDSILKLCAQSGHLLLARCLVYRVGEDMGLFDPLLGGEAMEKALAGRRGTIATEPFPALALTEAVRRRMVDILPLVYQLSDLDWWRVSEEKQATLESAQGAVVRDCQSELDLAIARMLRTLDGFHFASVDADVWRNVYQHYLPGEERQRLGGFYTPEILVEFILDMADYVPEAEGLCDKTVLDPACGSGAFVSIATARLLDHLSRPMPCHTSATNVRKRLPEWQRNKEVLDTVLSNVHGIDVHPFAAFLTTLNLTFLLLPLYAVVRKHNPAFPLALKVFSADSLEKPDDQSIKRDMFDQLNSRIQLSAESFERYRTLLTREFDLVVGNPPWGGVLKGPLAPVYDEIKKRRFKREYPDAANGKYDIYGLFMERGLRLLTQGGRFAMVTQDTYVDKEWARKLRKLLATECDMQIIVDLNPFGQLFFRAMNTPAITVFDNRSPTDGSFVSVTTTAPKFRETGADQRRALVLDTVRASLTALSGRRRQAVVDFCTTARLPRRMLRESAKQGWDLRPRIVSSKFKPAWLRITDVLEPRQGVTPGGCLDVFLMTEQRAKELGLETSLVHRAIKTRETDRWHPQWQGRVLLYPYVLEDDEAAPAFTIKGQPLTDALDFETVLDERDREIRRGRPMDNATARDILEHRIALGLVKYPQAARYLVQNYNRLESRIFEKRRLREWNKQWYEYHRPRDPKLLLTANRILSPTLAREVRCSLDTKGFLADHACLYLLPTAKTKKDRETLRQALSKVMGRLISDVELLQYCLVFLNSRYAQQALTRRRPTPKGSYQISEQYLSEIPVVLPPDRQDAETILQAVARLTQAPSPSERVALEDRLDKTLARLLG